MKKSTRKLYTIVTLYLICATSLSAQAAFFVDDILNEEIASFGRVVHLTLSSAELVADSKVSTFLESEMVGFPNSTLSVITLSALADQGWGIEIKERGAPITLGEFAYIVMRAFDLPGGVMYSLFPGPRYAARELGYLGLIPGNSSPYRLISGDEVVQVLGFALNFVQAQRA